MENSGIVLFGLEFLLHTVDVLALFFSIYTVMKSWEDGFLRLISLLYEICLCPNAGI